MSSPAAISQTSTEDMLKEVGAWQTGHFLLSSGLHSDQYVQCQRIMQYPRYGKALAKRLVAKLKEMGVAPTAVVGPALGAVHWELFVAEELDNQSDKQPIKAIFAERGSDPHQPEAFAIRRGVQLEPGELVLVVEDVTTTGGSAQKVIDLVRSLGAVPIAAGAIVDRSGGSVDFGIPFIKLLTLTLSNYESAHCPMCQKGQKIDKPGSSKK